MNIGAPSRSIKAFKNSLFFILDYSNDFFKVNAVNEGTYC